MKKAELIFSIYAVFAPVNFILMAAAANHGLHPNLWAWLAFVVIAGIYAVGQYLRAKHLQSMATTAASTKAPKLVFCAYNNTIRQEPESYLIAHKDGTKWLCEPDLAADQQTCIKVFTALLSFENKYEQHGHALLHRLTAQKPVKLPFIRSILPFIQSK